MAESAAIKFAEGKRFGDWTIGKKIDEGGFGQVYVVINRKTKARAALKAEPNDVEGGSAIKLEIQVLRTLNADGERPHVPIVYHAAKHTKYCYMIMSLLGDNFKVLKNANNPQTLSVSTWSRLGVQCLYALKVVHDYGFIHRDIKPNNFVMGHKEDADRSRVVYILDFGLARSYAFKGRRDDIWSLFYVLIELHVGLPWQMVRDKERIEKMKCNIRDEHLTQNFPRELRPIIPALRKLDCYQRPDYLSIYNAFLALMKRQKVQLDEPYDWEKAEPSKILKPSKKPAWQDAEEFFKSDTINVHGAPEKGENLQPTMNETLGKENTTESATGANQ